MDHPIYRIVSAKALGGYRIRVSFDDGSTRELDLEPVLHGELYGTSPGPSRLRCCGDRPGGAHACVAKRGRLRSGGPARLAPARGRNAGARSEVGSGRSVGSRTLPLHRARFACR
jgi:hypothetical protein